MHTHTHTHTYMCMCVYLIEHIYYCIISIDSIDILKWNYPNWVFHVMFIIYVDIYK